MKLTDKVVVVTGGAHGIGKALCERFAAEGARAVVVADLDARAAEAVATRIKGLAVPTDVQKEAELIRLVARAEQTYGRIDLFCSNAGIGLGGGVEVPDAQWQRIWEINVMSHVWAARAVLPKMLERKEGYLLQTASAAGLLTNIGAAPYAVTKHAAVSLAEWLAITYGDQGIKVSCLCPLGVKTQLLDTALQGIAGSSITASGPVATPEHVADAVVKGLEAEQFLILPHPEVTGYVQNKANDTERWLRGMRKMQARLIKDAGGPSSGNPPG